MGGHNQGYRSDTGGVTPMSIGGRMVYERERLFGMTDEERAWRAKFLKDQNLSHNEPRVVPEVYNELYNPIRRFYRTPLNKLQEMLNPKIGPHKAEVVRVLLGRGTIGLGMVLLTIYYFKYNGNDWEKHNGIKVFRNKHYVLPGQPGYPNADLHHPGSFYLDEKRGFTDAVPSYQTSSH